jgi:hypothetical protein
MILILSLSAVILAAAPGKAPDSPSAETDVQRLCTETQAACEDECEFTFGTSHTLRRELGNCLNRCLERKELCLLRYQAKSRGTPKGQ